MKALVQSGKVGIGIWTDGGRRSGTVGSICFILRAVFGVRGAFPSGIAGFGAMFLSAPEDIAIPEADAIRLAVDVFSSFLKSKLVPQKTIEQPFGLLSLARLETEIRSGLQLCDTFLSAFAH